MASQAGQPSQAKPSQKFWLGSDQPSLEQKKNQERKSQKPQKHLDKRVFFALKRKQQMLPQLTVLDKGLEQKKTQERKLLPIFLWKRETFVRNFVEQKTQHK